LISVIDTPTKGRDRVIEFGSIIENKLLDIFHEARVINDIPMMKVSK